MAAGQSGSSLRRKGGAEKHHRKEGRRLKAERKASQRKESRRRPTKEATRKGTLQREVRTQGRTGTWEAQGKGSLSATERSHRRG
eukprot:10806216-Heterocapsa_arctica.AAC.1